MEVSKNGWVDQCNSEGLITNRQYFINGKLERIDEEICQLPENELADYLAHYWDVIPYSIQDKPADSNQLDEWVKQFPGVHDLESGQNQSERLIWKFLNSFQTFNRNMYVESYLQLADFSYQKKQYWQGIHYAKIALQANLHHPSTFTYLGKGYYFLRMLADALHSLDTSITFSQLKNCETSMQYHYRGMVHVALKNKVEAMADMNKSFTIEPVYKTKADILKEFAQIMSNPK